MADSQLIQARREVRQRYGTAFEAKASDALVVRIARPVAFSLGKPSKVLEGRTFSGFRPRALRGGMEAVLSVEDLAEAAGTPLDYAIVEMVTPTEPLATPGAVAVEALQHVGMALDTLAPGESPMRAVRRLRASAARDSYERRAAPIREYLGRLSRRQRAAPNQPLTEVCWLNECLRTVANLPALASAAEDPAITRIGVPRLLRREDKTTASVLGVTEFRERTGASGNGLIVALIDSEAAISHAALQGKITQKQNYTSVPWGNPDSHGTAVAGIIVSQDRAVPGIAPGVTIYNYKVLASEEVFNADDFGGALAIQQALEDGVDIANCSWGAGPVGNGTSREARACDRAWNLGMTIVKSAGNAGPGLLTTPADATGVVVVGATDLAGTTLGAYSSYGSTADGRSRPHLVAPGGVPTQGMTSCLVAGGFGDCGYGTSYAAPHVTGVLALLLEQDRTRSPDDLRNTILALCHLLPGVPASAQGKGLPVMI